MFSNFVSLKNVFAIAVWLYRIVIIVRREGCGLQILPSAFLIMTILILVHFAVSVSSWPTVNKVLTYSHSLMTLHSS